MLKYSPIALMFALGSIAGCNNDAPRSDAPVRRDDAVRPASTTSLIAPTAAATEQRRDDALHALHQRTDGLHSESLHTTSGASAVADGDKREAEAVFKSAPQMKIKGDAELEEVSSGVQISIEVENAPAGQKGIHIHQTDNCSDIPNKSMGEHFAPTIPKHGLPGSAEHHLGDLGNITIDQDGKGKLEILVANANLKPNDPLSFLGKSIVLHESNDKGTGPSGDAGKPIACAPIRED